MPQTNLTSTRCGPPAPGEPQWTEEQHLVYLLANADIRCPRCGLNLRGLAGSRCPQCRSELTLSLSPARPASGAWIATMVPLCLSAGLGLFLLVVVIREGWPDGSVPTGIWLTCLEISLVYFIASIPFAIGAVVLKRRFQRIRLPTQRLIAAVSMASTGLALALFIGYWVTG